MAQVKFFGQLVFYFHGKAHLVEIGLEAICFKELNVIWRVIIHAIQRGVKAICQHAPPFVALAKVYGAVHSFHPSFLQPILTMVEHKVRCILVVDALKKAYAARWLLLFILSVHKYGYPSYVFTLIILQQPLCTLATL